MTSRTSVVECGARYSLEDLAKGLDACIEIICQSEETQFCRRLRKWSTDLIRCVSQEPTTSTRMRKAKSYFAVCREKAITGSFIGWGDFPPPPLRRRDSVLEKRKYLHQISRVSRTLREADNDLVSESLEAHWHLCQDAFETPAELLESFKSFVRSKVGSVVASFSGVGTSASFLRTAASGGAAQEVRDITDTFRAKKVSLLELKELVSKIPHFVAGLVTELVRWDFIGPMFVRGGDRVHGVATVRHSLEDLLFPYDRASELSLEDWEARREILFSLTACWFEIDFSELPRCRQVPVRERGYKVRIVTPLEAAFRYLLGVVNSGMLEGLKTLPQTAPSLEGRPAEKLDWTYGRRYGMVFSADLKSATDHFPQDLMQAGTDGWTEAWPSELRQLALRGVGPHVLTKADQNGLECTTSRGILMGSPVSWPLLSMYSAWLHELSGSDGWYSVCGDDYIGCHTHRTYKKYLAYRRLTGAIGSPGKDILGHQSVGVFAEELVTVGRCRWVPTVSVRAVLADAKADRPGWSQGPEVSEALKVLNLQPAAMGRVCERLHKPHFLLLRKQGIDPYGPRWCGGAGFPGIPLHSTLISARRMVSQDITTVVKWITRLESAWSNTLSDPKLVGAVTEDILRNIEFHRVVIRDSEDARPMRDVVSSRLASLSWPFYLAGSSIGYRRVGLSRIGRIIRGVEAEIASKGYWLPADSRVDYPGGIDRWLIDHEPLCKVIPFSPLLGGIRLDGVGQVPVRQARRKRTRPGFTDLWIRKRTRLI